MVFTRIPDKLQIVKMKVKCAKIKIFTFFSKKNWSILELINGLKAFLGNHLEANSKEQIISISDCIMNLFFRIKIVLFFSLVVLSQLTYLFHILFFSSFVRTLSFFIVKNGEKGEKLYFG
jgi:hypothetical protein